MTLAYPTDLTAPPEMAASHMVKRIPRATPDMSVGAVIQSLRGEQFDCADTIFVTDEDDRLEGIVRINDLLGDGDRPIREIMEDRHDAVSVRDDQEEIALLAMELDMIAVPVVDDDGKLIGAVPPERLFRILRSEHMEDLQRMAGIATHDRGPVLSLNAPLFDRFRRRLPWLVFGLVASGVITVVMAGFEESLSANVAVAFFIPALVYIAGAIGIQAVSVAVRGLSDDAVPIVKLLREEIIIGMAIGASLGLIAFVLVYLTFGSVPLALSVGLAVLMGGTLSAVVGFGLPWLFRQLGSDPALGSGPICTIIQDVVSLVVYFLLVSVLVL
jgi:magnesium transporter